MKSIATAIPEAPPVEPKIFSDEFDYFYKNCNDQQLAIPLAATGGQGRCRPAFRRG